MHVLKFGGTSVKDPAAITRLIDIVRRARELGAARRERPHGPIVVVSALSKVTDALLTIAARAADGETAEVTRLIEELRRRHYDTAAGVVRDRARRAALVPALDADLAELATLAHALVALRDASPRLQDAHGRDRRAPQQPYRGRRARGRRAAGPLGRRPRGAGDRREHARRCR